MHVHLGWIATTAVAVTLSLATAGFARAASDVPDGWVTTKVKMSLLTNEGVSGMDVDVDTIDGRVTLHGTVSNDAEKAKAEQVTKSIEGVREVNNLLQVVGSRAQAKSSVSDAQLQGRVAAALESDAALGNSSIAVESVNAGVVLLSGEARSLSDAYRAVRVASRVEGVRRVASEIESPDELSDIEIWNEGKSESSASPFSDSWITTKAKVGLMKDAGVSPMAVHVDTEDGVVTLFGTVNTQADKTRAEAAVAGLAGVKHVANELQIVPATAAAGVAQSDDRVSAAVRKRLEGRSSLDDSSLKVETAKGVVRLTGKVASHRDHVTALTTARGTPGVMSIIDDIELQSAPM